MELLIPRRINVPMTRNRILVSSSPKSLASFSLLKSKLKFNKVFTRARISQKQFIFLVTVLCFRIHVLVLSPSWELASQTEKKIQAIGVHTNIQAHACIGGKNIEDDIKKLECGVHAVLPLLIG